MENKKYTWQDLKDFANNLTEEQLKLEVICWAGEGGCKIEGTFNLECDYINPSGEGVEPITDYKNEEWAKDEPVVLEEGSPILFSSEYHSN